MRPVRVAIPATGTDGPVVPLDWYQVGPVTIAVVDVDGTVDIDIQYTLDDVFAADFDQSTAQWFAADNLQAVAAAAAAVLADDTSGLEVRATAIRAVNAGAGTAVLQVVQGGVMG